MHNLIGELEQIWRGIADDLGVFAIRAIEATLIAIVAVFLSKWVQRRVAQVARRSRMDANISALMGNIASIVIYALAGTLAFTLIGGNVAVSATFLGAATVALSLAFQDVLRSIVAGIYLLAERPFAIGERIQVKDAAGAVDAINLRTTTLSGADGIEYRVPNATLFSEIVTNRANAGPERVTVTISHLPLSLQLSAERIAGAIENVSGARGPTRFERYTSDGEHLSLSFSLPLDAGREIPATIIDRIHAIVPEAHISVERGS